LIEYFLQTEGYRCHCSNHVLGTPKRGLYATAMFVLQLKNTIKQNKNGASSSLIIA